MGIHIHIHRSAFIALALLLVLFSIQNAQANCWICPCENNDDGTYTATYQTREDCEICPGKTLACTAPSCQQISNPICLPADYYEFLHCNGEGYSGSNNEYDDFYCIQPDNLCEGQVGGPVNLADGSAWYRPDPDISLNNPFPLEIRHAYWSEASVRDHTYSEPPPLGWGWRINFYEWLKIDGSESNLVGIRRWTGAIDRFSIRANSPWIPEDGKREKLVQGNNYFELTDEEGISRIYRGTGEDDNDKFVMTSMGPAGVPDQAVEICYSQTSNPTSACVCGSSTPNVDGMPCKVVPASGNEIQVQWTLVSNHWMISSLTIGNETVASYEYDSNNNLQNYYRGGTSSSEIWTYSYTNQLLSNVQTPPLTPNGTRINAETHTWDCVSGSCKVIRTQTPTEDYSISYGNQSTTVTNNKTSAVHTVTFNAHGLPLTMTPATGCRSPIAAYLYNDKQIEPGQWRIGADVRAVQYADGSYTSMTLDRNGDPLKIHYGDNDDNAETWNWSGTVPMPFSLTWHPQLKVPLSISRAGVFSIYDETFVVFDYEDPQTAVTCEPETCSTLLDKTNFNKINHGPLRTQLQRIVRMGQTKNIQGTEQRAAYVQKFSYDSAGRLWKVQGPLTNQLVTLEYWADNESDINKRGRLKSKKVRVSTTAELVTTFNSYDLFGNPTSVTRTRLPKVNSSESDETWLLTYTNGRISSITNPLGKTWTYHYSPTGALSGITAPQGNTVKYSYDLNGLLSAIGRFPSLEASSPWDEMTLSHEDGRGNLTKTEYKKNNTVKYRKSYGYDSHDRLSWEGIWRTGTTSPDYYKVYGYNAGWRLATLTDANHAMSSGDTANANLQYSYFLSGELNEIKRKNPSNTFELETNITRDAFGKPDFIQDAASRAAGYDYDGFERLIQITEPLRVQYAYDAAGRLSVREEAMHMGDYSSSGEPLTSQEQITYQYDLSNRLIGKTGTNLQWSAVLDAAPISVTSCFGNASVTLGNRGWRLASATRNNTTIQFGYDAAGRVTQEARKDPDKDCYHIFRKTYTDNGNLSSLIYPSGRIVEYIYPASPTLGDVDHPIQLKMTLGNVESIILNNISYEAGYPVQWTDNSGLRTTVTRNLDGTIARRKVEYCPPNDTCSDFFDWQVTSRDGEGNVTGITKTDTDESSRSDDFSYTAKNELSSKTDPTFAGMLRDKFYFEYLDAGDRSEDYWQKFYTPGGWQTYISTYQYSNGGFQLQNVSKSLPLPMVTRRPSVSK